MSTEKEAAAKALKEEREQKELEKSRNELFGPKEARKSVEKANSASKSIPNTPTATRIEPPPVQPPPPPVCFTLPFS